ncbi:MAG: hypothetical protein V3R37_08285 [Rhodospirillales bacterium]
MLIKLFTSFVAMALCANLLGACAKPRPGADVTPSGRMDILGPLPDSNPGPLPGDWVTEGKPADGQLAVVELSAIPALRIINGPTSFASVKPTRASMLATPYLSWSWNMTPQEVGDHPVKIVVGFHGGVAKNPGWQTAPKGKSGKLLPPHDRAVVLLWGLSALQRGAITTPPSKGKIQAPARYIARGGSENTRTWWLETVDLSDIYRRAWPDDKTEDVRIVFIGIAAAAGPPPSPGHIADLWLSR